MFVWSVLLEKRENNDVRPVQNTDFTERIGTKITWQILYGFPVPSVDEIRLLVSKIKRADTRTLLTVRSFYEFVQRTHNMEKYNK
jgi:hypothetical protein